MAFMVGLISLAFVYIGVSNSLHLCGLHSGEETRIIQWIGEEI